MTSATRFPAEWEPQSGVLVAWPHAGTDWAGRLDSVEATYVALVAAVSRFETMVICVPDAQLRQRAARLLGEAGVAANRLRFHTVPYDDTWLRDSGPLTLRADDGFLLLDFHFTAWGGKFDAGLDDQIVLQLDQQGAFTHAVRQRLDFALEGGAVETDGAGTLLSTWRCLHERHPSLGRAELAEKLQGWLQQHRVLWLDHGYLEGDDTDAHIDTLARFVALDAIAFQGCQDAADPHFQQLQAMKAQLQTFRTVDDKPYRLYELPWPQPIRDGGRRLAASYANFLLINGALLMPAYDDAADSHAAAVLAAACPEREIIPVPCRSLIWQNGSLHCLTMQLPEGLVQ